MRILISSKQSVPNKFNFFNFSIINVNKNFLIFYKEKN